MKKAVRKTRIIERVYWDCGIQFHNHQTEEVANRCIRQQDRDARRKHIRLTKDQYILRNIKVTRMIIEGDTLSQAGKRSGLSPFTVRGCVRAALRKTKWATNNWKSGDPYYFDSLEEIRAAKDFWLPALEALEKEVSSRGT